MNGFLIQLILDSLPEIVGTLVASLMAYLAGLAIKALPVYRRALGLPGVKTLSLRSPFRLFLEFILMLLGAFLSIRVAWPAPAFFVALFFFMCALGLFSFTKSPVFNPQIFVSLGIFLLVALIATWLLNEFVASAAANDPTLFTRNLATQFLIGNDTLRSFWVTVAGFLIALLVVRAFTVSRVSR